MKKIEDRFYKLHHSFMPSTRIAYALDKGTANNWLVSTWGGIGDVICAEPTLRYALENFKDVKITLATMHPELFSHLNFHDVYDLKNESPIMDDYLYFETIPNQDKYNLTPQFISHMITHCIDYPSLAAFRMQLPIKGRNIILNPPTPEMDRPVMDATGADRVIVHAGLHWKSKTFPKKWWDEVLDNMILLKLKPVLIGKKDGPGQGYVDVNTEGCIDLREKTTLSESIWLLQNSQVLICNDSSPMHMAASGAAYIGFLATVKHPDYLMHYRGPWNDFGWRMENLSLGGLWDHVSYQPNIPENLDLDNCDESLMETFLPEPVTVARWACAKNNEYFN